MSSGVSPLLPSSSQIPTQASLMGLSSFAEYLWTLMPFFSISFMYFVSSDSAVLIDLRVKFFAASLKIF